MSQPLVSRAFARLLLVNTAFQFGFATFFLLPKYMARELGAGPSQIGALTTVFGLSMIAAVPLVGRLLDRLGNRRVLLLGCALAAAAALAYTTVERVGGPLFALRALQGLSLSMVVNSGSVIAANRAPAGRLAQSIGLFAGSGMIMTAAAPSLAEIVADRAGYAPTFVAASAAASLAFVLGLGLEDDKSEDLRRGSFSRLLQRATSLRMISVLAAAGLGFGAMFALSLPFSLELGMVNVREFFIAFTAGALFVRLGLGGLIDRVGHRRIATLSLWSYAAAVGAMYLLTPSRLALLGALFGLAHGLFIPAFTAFVVSQVASYERAKLLTLFNGAFNLGNSLVFVLGLAVERYGYRSVFAATGAVVLTAPLALLGWPDSPALLRPAAPGVGRVSGPADVR